MEIDKSWRPWFSAPDAESPYRYRKIELARVEWPKPVETSAWDLRPELNGDGLYWRPLEAGGRDAGQWHH